MDVHCGRDSINWRPDAEIRGRGELILSQADCVDAVLARDAPDKVIVVWADARLDLAGVQACELAVVCACIPILVE